MNLKATFSNQEYFIMSIMTYVIPLTLIISTVISLMVFTDNCVTEVSLKIDEVIRSDSGEGTGIQVVPSSLSTGFSEEVSVSCLELVRRQQVSDSVICCFSHYFQCTLHSNLRLNGKLIVSFCRSCCHHFIRR